jgi:hypothetical protein
MVRGLEDAESESGHRDVVVAPTPTKWSEFARHLLPAAVGAGNIPGHGRREEVAPSI